MDKQKIQLLLGALRIKGSQVGDWMQASCPFAPFRHNNGTDNHPSWAVSIAENGESHHACYSCRSHGSMFELVMDLRRLYKKNEVPADADWKAAVELSLEDGEDALVDDFDDMETKKPTLTLFPEVWVKSFLPGHMHPYLKERGIPQGIAHELEFRYDSDKQRICLPSRDRCGRLVGFYGRDVTGLSDLRYLTYKYQGGWNPHHWIGEDKVSWDDPVILTEGPMDYARGYLTTKQMLASNTSAVTYKKLDRLKDAPMLITMYDLGTGGDNARKEITKWSMKNKVPLLNLIPDTVYGDLGATPPERFAEMLDLNI